MSDEMQSPEAGAESPDLGQASIPADGGQATAPAGEAKQVFHSWVRDDGEKHDFSSPDDLNKFLRDGVLMRGDYTKKTQTLAEERKAHEEKAKLFEREYSEWLGKKQNYDRYDQVLKGMTPQEFDKLVRQVRQTQRQVPPEYQALQMKVQALESEQRKAIEAQKAKEQQQKAEERKNKVFDVLSKRIPEFNKDAIMQAIEEINGRFPDGMDEETRAYEEMLSFAELLHYAGIGRKRGNEILEEVQKKLQTKGTGAQPALGPSIKGGPAPSAKPKNLREAAELAKKQLGLA